MVARAETLSHEVLSLLLPANSWLQPSDMADKVTSKYFIIRV